jgi:hypothetical protein
MVKNSSDQFSKQFLEELLLPLGVVETSYEVAGEPQLVDDFVPDQSSCLLKHAEDIGSHCTNALPI